MNVTTEWCCCLWQQKEHQCLPSSPSNWRRALHLRHLRHSSWAAAATTLPVATTLATAAIFSYENLDPNAALGPFCDWQNR